MIKQRLSCSTDVDGKQEAKLWAEEYATIIHLPVYVI